MDRALPFLLAALIATAWTLHDFGARDVARKFESARARADATTREFQESVDDIKSNICRIHNDVTAACVCNPEVPNGR